MRNIAYYFLPTIAFLLPWQTRWIYGQASVVGESFELGVMSIYGVEIFILLACAGAWMLHLLSDRKKTRAEIALCVFFAFGLFSAVWAIQQSLVLAQAVHLGIAIVFFLFILRSHTPVRPMLWGFVLGLMIPTLLGIWQFVGAGSGASTLLGLALRDAQTLGDAVLMVGGERVLRAYGSFPHPNIFGGYLAVGLLGVVHLWQTARQQARRWLVVIGAMLFVGLVLTFSRSAWMGFIFAVGLCILWGLKSQIRGWRAWLSAVRGARVAIAVVVVAVALLSPFITSRFSFDETIESRSFTERVEQYGDFKEIWFDDWVVGVGLGNYTFAVERLEPTREWWQYQPVHNSWALMIAELGIIGLFFSVVVIAFLLNGFLFDRTKSRSSRFVLFAILPLFIISLFDHYLWSLWPGLALLAFAGAIGLKQSTTYEEYS